MSRWRRILNWAVAVLLLIGVVIAAGAWWLNSYIQSADFFTLAKAEAGRLTGARVDFASLNWDRNHAIEARDWRMAAEGAQTAPATFSAEEIKLFYRWKTLWQGRLEINKFLILNPLLVITQNAAGDCLLPIRLKGKVPAPDEGARKTPLPINANLQSFRALQGNIRVEKANGTPILTATGIDVDASVTDDDLDNFTASGAFRIREMTLFSKFKMTELQSPFGYRAGALDINGLQGDAYKGKISVVGRQSLIDPQFPSTFIVNAQNLDVTSLFDQILNQTGIISGKLDAETEWYGQWARPLDMAGKGSLRLKNGQVVNLLLFRDIARVLNLNVLAQPDFSQCGAEFTIADQTIHFSALTLKSAFFDFSATGWAKFDTSLSLNVKMALSPEITGQLPAKIDERLARRVDGFRLIEFNVTGTVESPQTDLPRQLLPTGKSASDLVEAIKKAVLPGKRRSAPAADAAKP